MADKIHTGSTDVPSLNAAQADGGPIVLVTQRQAEREVIDDPEQLYEVGTLAKIAQVDFPVLGVLTFGAGVLFFQL